MVGDALRWIETTGNRVADFLCGLYEKKTSSVGKTKLARRQNDHKLLKEQLPEELRREIADALGVSRESGPGTLLRLARKETIAACAVILLFVVGIRISELLSLRRQCVCRFRHSDGRDYDYIKGIRQKLGASLFTG